MKFKDLVERLGVPARQVRYMIEEGLIPEARGTGRAADVWDEIHVERGLRALDLHERGFSLGSVKVLMQGGQTVPIATYGPITLSVDPSVDPASIDAKAALEAIAAALQSYATPPSRTEPATEE
jgi:DNA-binding transcriptional MerR regulator